MTQQLVNHLNKQVEQHIHGEGRDQILQALEQKPDADGMAEIAYSLVRMMAEQAEGEGTPLELDVLMGVVTETIDTLIEILVAMGQAEDSDELREETLIKVMLLHMRAVENDPEEVIAAQEILEELQGDGSMDQIAAHLQERGAMPQQQPQPGPRQNPLAAGVQQGLMEE